MVVFVFLHVNIHYYLISETRSNEPITIQQQIKDTTRHLGGATFNTGSLYMYMCIFINSFSNIHTCIRTYDVCMYFVCISPGQRNLYLTVLVSPETEKVIILVSGDTSTVI